MQAREIDKEREEKKDKDKELGRKRQTERRGHHIMSTLCERQKFLPRYCMQAREIYRERERERNI